MSKLTLTDILAGYASNDALNANWDSIIDAIENTLSRDGTTPNQMEADLDMNGYAILNTLATGSTDVNFTNRGDWTTPTNYSKNNIVYVPVSESATNGGKSYIAKEDHTSSSSFDDDISKWQQLTERGATGAGTGDMLAANNLSDVASASTSRTNLGLGSIATQDSNSVSITGGSISGTSVSSLSSDLAVADGGTGAGTFTDGGVLVGNGTSAIQATTAGTSGQVLTSNGAGVDPTFQAAPAGAWELISTTNITAVSAIDVTFDETTYNEIKVVIEDAIPATDGVKFRTRMLYSNGSSVETGSVYHSSGSTSTAWTLTPDYDSSYTYVGTAAGEGFCSSIDLYAFGTAYSGAAIRWAASYVSEYGSPKGDVDGGFLDGGTDRAYDGLRFYWSSGNFEANGTIKVYGLKRS